MKPFHRRRGIITTGLDAAEADLLVSLTTQLIDLLDEGRSEEERVAAESDDPFDWLAQDLQTDPDQPELPDDPVIQRLFPNAYPHDAEASSDFRRFTGREMRRAKMDSAEVVRADVVATQQGTAPLQIADDRTDAWLRTLSALRLSMAARLGIDDDESAAAIADLPSTDPRAFLSTVYDWLGYCQESLIGSLRR